MLVSLLLVQNKHSTMCLLYVSEINLVWSFIVLDYFCNRTYTHNRISLHAYLSVTRTCILDISVGVNPTKTNNPSQPRWVCHTVHTYVRSFVTNYSVFLHIYISIHSNIILSDIVLSRSVLVILSHIWKYFAESSSSSIVA